MRIKKEVLGWCLFDVANSSYTTLIITVAFGVVFTKLIVGPDATGSFQTANSIWSAVLAVSWAIVAILGPFVGAWTDSKRYRKKALLVSVVLCSGASALLWFVGPGDIWLACWLVVVSNVGFALSENLIATFLPHLVSKQSTGKVSGLGWGLGYLGGLVSVVLAQRLTGLDYRLENLDALRWIGPLVAVFFVVASTPSLLWLKEPAAVAPAVPTRFALQATQWRALFRASPMLGKILWSCFFFQAGIAIVISFTALYAEQQMHFSGSMQALLFLTLQVSAALGAFGFGWLQSRFHPIAVLNATLYLWLASLVGIFLIQPVLGSDTPLAAWAFLGFCNVAGLGLGATQSCGRVLVSLSSLGQDSNHRSGAFFGLWGMSVKLAQVVGLLGFAMAQAYFPIRQAMLFCAVCFVVPLLIHRHIDRRAI
jgi:MFS transporter, UMF1 family